MYTITGTITGVAPLLFSRPYDVIEGRGAGKKTDKEREDEPFKRLHLDPERGVYIPKGAFKKSLLEGIKMAGIKQGKRSAYGIVEATVFPAHDLYLGKTTFDRVFDTPARVPPRTGSLVIIRYPVFEIGWSADFTLIVVQDSQEIVGFVREGLAAAGFLVGVGSWRPEHGRFEVSKCDVSQKKAA